jgi:NADP-dependent 3-hydroxy acid dehydrogenase YdfG
MIGQSPKSKVIVITGGSSGIGRATALQLAPECHSFLLIGRNEERLEDTCREVEELGGKAIAATGDVASAKDVEKQYRKAIDEFGRVDVLIANAGVGYFGNLEELTIQEYDEQFDTNVRGVFLWIKQVLPNMKERDAGQIVVTSSNLGLETSARASIYAATKHAVQAMVGSLRKELKDTNVKAATVNPGSVSTPWFDGKNVDRSKMLSAEDVARAFKMIIDQGKTSDIDHIHLLPTKR